MINNGYMLGNPAYIFCMSEKLIIESLKENCKLREYLIACGFVKGAEVEVLAKSPLKKTVLLSINDSVISLKTNVLSGVIWKK